MTKSPRKTKNNLSCKPIESDSNVYCMTDASPESTVSGKEWCIIDKDEDNKEKQE